MSITAPFDIVADLDTPVSAFLKLHDLQPLASRALQCQSLARQKLHHRQIQAGRETKGLSGLRCQGSTGSLCLQKMRRGYLSQIGSDLFPLVL